MDFTAIHERSVAIMLIVALLFVALPTTCENLVSLKLTEATITLAQSVAKGAFMPVAAGGSAQPPGPFKDLPAFCRVAGTLKPTSDSNIEFEVWLPASNWNGKYLGVGNGGFAGSINYTGQGSNPSGMAGALKSGFATSSTDTGHKGAATDGSWAKDHPEKVIDFDYRAIHETAEISKAIIRGFYGADPKYSYFSSCSNGGRQGLMEVQRYQGDYDGVLAGAPAGTAGTVTTVAWVAQALAAEPGSYIPANKLPTIEAAALAACDAKDGLKDGLISEPAKCRFDPATLLCKAADSASCLTRPQVTALKKIYEGPRDSNGIQLAPGYLPGGETGGTQDWTAWISGPGPGRGLASIFAAGASDMNLGVEFNVTEFDLKPFQSRGGKLILWQGWSDPAIPAMDTIDYYNGVVAQMRQSDSSNFIRLYMAPGMQHCGGGPGPNTLGAGPTPERDAQHNMFSALERWVETGVAPGEIIATKYEIDGNPASGILRTRPLCPYPQVASYKGAGSIDDAANFVCRVP